MIEQLHKIACGFYVDEQTDEYIVEEDGNKRLVKQKIKSRYLPPDIAAIKICLDYKDKELYAMSAERLKEERKRLLRELFEIEERQRKLKEWSETKNESNGRTDKRD
ncbi:MAG: hypothetical protein ACOYEC_05990 [Christensenellales bacterium]|jgi:hypothetical protein|nr:hypothetical protein [Clostridiales bacterium]